LLIKTNKWIFYNFTFLVKPNLKLVGPEVVPPSLIAKNKTPKIKNAFEKDFVDKDLLDVGTYEGGIVIKPKVFLDLMQA